MRVDHLETSEDEAVLISISCTTGWADWVHGELWLLPDGLARFSLGLTASVANRNLPGSFGIGETRPVSSVELDERAGSNSRNFVVRADEIDLAVLRRGIITGRLLLHLSDGKTKKLLWKRTNKTLIPLDQALHRWLGDGLIKG
jgi:hypothetical protein